MAAPAYKAPFADGKTPRQRCLDHFNALKAKRSIVLPKYRDLNDFIFPRRMPSLRNKQEGASAWTARIINNAATFSARSLAAGMMAAITSPARPWFRLATSNPDFMDSAAVRDYLHLCEEIMRWGFQRSNIYAELPGVYLNLVVWGTDLLHIDEDDDLIIRAYDIPVGEYCLAQNSKREIDTVYREIPMTVSQVVEQFGIENCSKQVQTWWQSRNWEQRVDVLHVVEPNREYEAEVIGPEGMRFSSCWYEATGDDPNTGCLREGGYNEFPDLASRWDVVGNDVYGVSPAMDALGDIKGIQIYERRKAEAIELMVKPTMKAPTSLSKKRWTMLPGDTTYVDESSGTKYEPAYVVDPNAVRFAEESIAQGVQRVGQAFYSNFWLQFSNGGPPGSGSQMTATEIQARSQEAMLQLGPMLMRVETEILSPLVGRLFATMNRRGLLPPPPPEIAGQDIRVEFKSILSDAQKLPDTVAIQQLVGFAANAGELKPDSLDNINFDRAIEEYGRVVGVKPDIVNTPEQVQQIRDQRAQAAQAQQIAQNLAQGAAVAKTMGETSMEGDTALSRLTTALAGPAAAGLAGGGARA